MSDIDIKLTTAGLNKEQSESLYLLAAKGRSQVTSSNVRVSNVPNQVREDTLTRMRKTTFQARLGRRLDGIQRRTLDNAIRLSGHPTDMIRIEVKRDPRSQDIISRKITETEILPIMLPPMKDIPLRQLKRGDTEIQVPSLYTIDQTTYFEAYCPVECNLNEDDLLIRILWDSTPDMEEPYIMALQVSEVFGTFGYSSLRWKKVWVRFYDEKLPTEIVQIIRQANTKRETLGY